MQNNVKQCYNKEVIKLRIQKKEFNYQNQNAIKFQQHFLYIKYIH